MALHVCPYCHKKYTRFSILRNHLKKHSGDKPFKCSKCELAFGRRWDLKQHELTHDLSGSYKYKCEGGKDGVKWGCGVGFHRNYDLQRHVNRPTGHRCRQPKPPEGPTQDDGREAAEVLAGLKHGNNNQDSDLDDACLTILHPALHTLYATHEIFKKSVTVLYLVLDTPDEGKQFEVASTACDGFWTSAYQLLRKALESGMDDALALCIFVLLAIELACERYEGIPGHLKGLRVWAADRPNAGHDSVNNGATQVASAIWQHLHTNNGSVTELPKLAANHVVARLLFRSTPRLDALSLVQSMLSKADKHFGNDSQAPVSDLPSQQHKVSSSLASTTDETHAGNVTIPVKYPSMATWLALPPMWPSLLSSNNVRNDSDLQPTHDSLSLGHSEPPAGSVIDSTIKLSSKGIAQESTTNTTICPGCEMVGLGALFAYNHTHFPFQCSSLGQFTSDLSGRECSFETHHGTILLWHLAEEHSIKSSERADSLATAVGRNDDDAPLLMAKVLPRLRIAIKASEQLSQMRENPSKDWRSFETSRYMAIVTSVIHHKLHRHDDVDVIRCLPYLAAQIYRPLNILASSTARLPDTEKHLLDAMEAWVVYYKTWPRFSGRSFFGLVGKLQAELRAIAVATRDGSPDIWQLHGSNYCPCGLFDAETGYTS